MSVRIQVETRYHDLPEQLTRCCKERELVFHVHYWSPQTALAVGIQVEEQESERDSLPGQSVKLLEVAELQRHVVKAAGTVGQDLCTHCRWPGHIPHIHNLGWDVRQMVVEDPELMDLDWDRDGDRPQVFRKCSQKPHSCWRLASDQTPGVDWSSGNRLAACR